MEDSELGRNRADKLVEVTLSLAVLADTNSRWQPKSFNQRQINNELKFEFATVKLLNYESQLEELQEKDNAFALLTAAHLITKRTKHDPKARKDGKLTLVKLLYKNGWNREKIVNFFAILDWLMQLPPIEALEFNTQLAQLEEEKKMRYVTSVERIGIQKGMEQGVENNLRQNVINLFNNLNLTAEKIAEALEVPLEKIKQILNQQGS